MIGCTLWELHYVYVLGGPHCPNFYRIQPCPCRSEAKRKREDRNVHGIARCKERGDNGIRKEVFIRTKFTSVKMSQRANLELINSALD